jgi:hypothetical protein
MSTDLKSAMKRMRKKMQSRKQLTKRYPLDPQHQPHFIRERTRYSISTINSLSRIFYSQSYPNNTTGGTCCPISMLLFLQAPKQKENTKFRRVCRYMNRRQMVYAKH